MERASFTQFITFLTHEDAPKLIYSNVEFTIFSGGVTLGPPLRGGGIAPSRTHLQHGIWPCAVAVRPIIPTPQIVSPYILNGLTPLL